MTRRRWAGLTTLLAAVLTVSSGPAAPQPPGEGADHRPPRLAELIVREPSRCLPARSPPDKDVPAAKVVDSFPKDGAVVRPGIIVIRVTFDLPMTCAGALLRVPGLENPCEDLDQPTVLSFDRRTIRVGCVLHPNTRYGVSVNVFNQLRFVGLAGWPARAHELRFQTSGEPLVKTTLESLAQDPQSASLIGRVGPEPGTRP